MGRRNREQKKLKEIDVTDTQQPPIGEKCEGNVFIAVTPGEPDLAAGETIWMHSLLALTQRCDAKSIEHRITYRVDSEDAVTREYDPYPVVDVITRNPENVGDILFGDVRARCTACGWNSRHSSSWIIGRPD